MAKKRSAQRSPSRPSPSSSTAPRAGAARGRRTALLVGTVKGGFALLAGPRGKWEVKGPFHLGTQVHDMLLDPRDGKTLLMTSGGGHLGPTLLRSTNLGRTWKESTRPPRFDPLPKQGSRKQRGKHGAEPVPREDGTSRGLAVKQNFWLSPAHESEPGAWYLGTGPQGLFRSEDAGDTWEGVQGYNLNPKYADWTGTTEGTPVGSLLHSVCVDPRDPAHLYISTSPGGTFESTDRGESWRPLNKGVEANFMPDPYPEYGHDPHCVIVSPADPDLLWQQNHCGIYRLDRNAGDGVTWDRVGERMPKRIGDIGFGVVGHPTDRDTAWVFPMDGTSIWPRTSPDGKPACYRTTNGGKRWERLDSGFPTEHGYFTVLRQAFDGDGDPKGPTLFLGTTSGEIWAGAGGGERWKQVAQHLPKIQSLRVARV